ncbi:MAG: DUF3575 domain-containing protein [Alistipes sp.]
MAAAQNSMSADTVSTCVYYKYGYSTFGDSYKGNKERLDAVAEHIANVQQNHSRHIISLSVIGGASPDGSSTHNKRLALRRASNLGKYLSERVNVSLSAINISSLGIDWGGVIATVSQARKPYRDEVVAIIDNTPEWIYSNGKIVDGRKRRLMNLHGGNVWRDMQKDVFPALRKGEIIVVCDAPRSTEVVSVPATADEPQTLAADTTTTIVSEHTQPTSVCNPQPAQTAETPATARSAERLRKTVVALRTNLLLPLLNFGIEIPIGNRWSVGADYYYPWSWRKDNHKNCFELLFWSVEGRYWFGKQHTAESGNERYRLTGHSAGVYAAGGYYDIEHNYSGHQGTCYSVGVDYLYSLPVARGKANFEFSLAVGYIYSYAQPYYVREENGRLFRKRGIKNRISYLGPTKATVSLVVPIGKTINK